MIALSHIYKQYGPQILFVDASFQLNPGEKVGLVGPNGAGKSTILRLVAGEESVDEGDVSVPRRATIGFFRQDTGGMQGRSVIEETIAGAGEVATVGARLHALEHEVEDPTNAERLDRLVEELCAAQERFQALGGYGIEARAAEILAGLGLGADRIHDDVGTLSGGWKMRVALARILLQRPEVLLLDEPTNYLDIESILWLETFLKEYPGALMMTTHDRDFMNRVVDRIVEIDGGELTSYTGDYDFYEKRRDEDLARREAAYERQQSMLAKEMRFSERFRAHAAKAAQVQSRLRKLEKIERLEPPRRYVKAPRFGFRTPGRSGDDVLGVDGLSKAFGPRRVYDGFDWLVRRKERWAVMGQNGAGKSTLLKIIAGAMQPDGGAVRAGAGVVLGYYSQITGELLGKDRTVYDELAMHANKATIGQVKSLAGAFGFPGDDMKKPIEVLSGGECARVVLAKLLYDAPNLLVLDEPTNHLDLATKAHLVELLSDYDGTMIFVSHDRAFLRALSTRVLEVGDGPPRAYSGTYDEYVASTGREAPGMRAAAGR